MDEQKSQVLLHHSQGKIQGEAVVIAPDGQMVLCEKILCDGAEYRVGGCQDEIKLQDNLELIKAVGYEHVMVDTDGGQVENPRWEIAMEEYMQYLADHGIPMEQVDHMTKVIPARLLGIR